MHARARCWWMTTCERATRMTSKKNTNNGIRTESYCQSRDKININAVHIFDDKWRWFLPQAVAFDAIMRCSLSFFLLATLWLNSHSLSLSLSLSLLHFSSVSLSLSLSTFPLSALHVDFSLDSRQHALLFFIPRRNPRLFPFIPVFSAHLDTAHRLIMDLLTVLQQFRRGSFYSCDRYYYVAATTSAKPVSILALR